MFASKRIPAASLAIVAVALTGVYCAAFYPGAMGFDAAYQWWQARGGETTNIHGIGLTWLWRLTDLFATGPAPIFLIQLALFWLGVVLIVVPLELPLAARIILLLAIAMSPIYLTLFSSVVSDALLAAVLCSASAVMFATRNGAARIGATRAVIVVALLIIALLLRKNAAFAVFPLLAYLVYAWTSARWKSGTLAKSIALSAALVLIMQGVVSLADRTVDRRVTIFAGTALWDLAALSIATNQVLIPAHAHGPGLDVDDIRQAFSPFANTTLFAKTHAGMRQPFLNPDNSLNEEIRDAWIAAIVHHPRDYLRHRLGVTRYLFGSKGDDIPRELVYFPDEYRYRENPDIAPNASAFHRWAIEIFDALRGTSWFAAWPYVLVAFASFGVAWTRRESISARAAMALSLSGLLYAAPLTIIAPSAELRYMGWTCLSALLSAAMAWAARREGLARAREPIASEQ